MFRIYAENSGGVMRPTSYTFHRIEDAEKRMEECPAIRGMEVRWEGIIPNDERRPNIGPPKRMRCG